MLHIMVPSVELYYDEIKNEFLYSKEQHLQLEHSLVSISKWETKWHKPFLGSGKKTDEELSDYIQCMTITQNVDPESYINLTPQIVQQIINYINDSMTATWFADDKNNNKKKGSNNKIVTSELIYYWMIELKIPVEFQKWHLNRLLTLIKVCNVENEPPKKMSKREIMSRNKALNDARRNQLQSKG